MSKQWLGLLNIDPIPCLLDWSDPALAYFVRRDLLAEPVSPIESLWDLPAPKRLVEKQQPVGSWSYPGKSFDPWNGTHYDLLETFRSLRVLVEMYGFTRNHPALGEAANFVFSCQTAEGDIRGILGNQYMPYYHGALLELLVKAGFVSDERIEKGLDWLLSIRQVDGGWLIPTQFVPAKRKTGDFWLGEPLQGDPLKPASHLATGMALRAFAAHPGYRQRAEVHAAGSFLKGRLFQPDKYNDRKAPSYWLKFQYPFWWTSLLTALDTLSWLGFSKEDGQVAQGLDWFLGNQASDGLWETGYSSGRRAEENRRWVGLAACRVLKRYFDESMNL